MGVSTGMAMWIAVAQLPVMMGLALHYPTVRVDVFATATRTVQWSPALPLDNATSAPAAAMTVVASDDSSAVFIHGYEHGLGISGLYVLNAAAITFFAVLSMNLLDRGFAAAAAIADEGRISSMIAEEDFVSQNVGMVVDPTFRCAPKKT